MPAAREGYWTLVDYSRARADRTARAAVSHPGYSAASAVPHYSEIWPEELAEPHPDAPGRLRYGVRFDWDGEGVVARAERGPGVRLLREGERAPLLEGDLLPPQGEGVEVGRVGTTPLPHLCEPRIRYCPGGSPGQPRWGTAAGCERWLESDREYCRVLRPYRAEPLAEPHTGPCPAGCPRREPGPGPKPEGRGCGDDPGGLLRGGPASRGATAPGPGSGDRGRRAGLPDEGEVHALDGVPGGDGAAPGEVPARRAGAVGLLFD